MQPVPYARHRFPPEIIRLVVWLYLRFTWSYRDVEELLAERRLNISCETIRRWVLKFGPAFTRNLRQLRPRASDRIIPAGRNELAEMSDEIAYFISHNGRMRRSTLLNTRFAWT
jgi:hypothetical protein